MLELGRPTHFYDLKKIPADRLTVRWAREGESVQLLNGETVALDPWYGVICAGDEPECLAGIMGGESSSISTETTDLFIESAFWFPKAIQGRCRKLNFSTDAAYRYERGVDFASTAEHLEYITRLVLDICGTPETTVGPVADVQTALPTRAPVKMRVDRCRKVVGVEIPVESMETSFKRLGFDFTYDDGVFTVVPPSFRFDIEIEEDLIEEVARLYGLEILRRGIETNKHNFTRFLLLADERRAAEFADPAHTDKASLLFTLSHTQGSLSKVLTVLSFYDINLTKIQSLPIIGREWEYRFYVDVTFDDRVRYRQAIDAARPLTSDFRILGEYAECPNPAI